MTRCWWLVCWLVACAWAPPVVPDESEPLALPQVPPVAAAMPGVVLIVAHRPGGEIGYGGGAILAPDRIATNLHVVEGATRLELLLHRADRASYAPIDGGLARLLFEAEDDLIPARLLRGDPTLDLAVISPMQPTELPDPLPMREEPVAPGERIFALGHPKESAWSSSAGVVSATHQATIQHDASINQGNSGGPLVDEQGRVVGLNTYKIIGDAEGLGFARPIPFVRALVDDTAAPVQLDLSSPDRALLSCERAVEVAPASAEPCVAWESFELLADRVVERAIDLARLPPEPAQRLRAWNQDVGRAELVARHRESVLYHFAGGGEPLRPSVPYRPPPLFDDDNARDAHAVSVDLRAVIARERDRVAAVQEAYLRRLADVHGLRVDPTTDSRGYREVQRMGLRVRGVRLVEPAGIAWVHVQGRNVDGSPYEHSECWSRTPDGYRASVACSGDHAQTLPEDWPPVLIDEADVIARHALRLVALIFEVPVQPLPPRVVPPRSRGGASSASRAPPLPTP